MQFFDVQTGLAMRVRRNVSHAQVSGHQGSGTPWWHGAVIYQLYVRSWRDSNDDGYGDLRGIIERLDYLSQLGVDAVWLSPTMPSPDDDWGYDVSDYTDVHPDLGTLADLDELIDQAGQRGMRVLLDRCRTTPARRTPGSPTPRRDARPSTAATTCGRIPGRMAAARTTGSTSPAVPPGSGMTAASITCTTSCRGSRT